jgi:hypothetical protein
MPRGPKGEKRPADVLPARGQPAATPPGSLMNSRRLMTSPLAGFLQSLFELSQAGNLRIRRGAAQEPDLPAEACRLAAALDRREPDSRSALPGAQSVCNSFPRPAIGR